jgi:hypothetical protein
VLDTQRVASSILDFHFWTASWIVLSMLTDRAVPSRRRHELNMLSRGGSWPVYIHMRRWVVYGLPQGETFGERFQIAPLTCSITSTRMAFLCCHHRSAISFKALHAVCHKMIPWRKASAKTVSKVCAWPLCVLTRGCRCEVFGTQGLGGVPSEGTKDCQMSFVLAGLPHPLHICLGLAAHKAMACVPPELTDCIADMARLTVKLPR